MKGKNKCKILKQIRSEIARNNDIDYVTSECKYQGDCSGTCPKCEAEVRYLEQELEKRRKAGKAVAVAGIATALMVGSTGCSVSDLFTPPLAGDVPYVQPENGITEETVLDGDVAAPTQEDRWDDLAGVPAYDPTEEAQWEDTTDEPEEGGWDGGYMGGLEYLG
jgi:hypothetical protein